MNFSKNLTYLRKQKGCKLDEIASKTGFSRSQWNNYELGTSYPKFLDLIKISKYFDISETDLIHHDLELMPINKIIGEQKITNQLNEETEVYNINYKDLAEARKETIDCLKKEINHLEEKIASLTNKRKAG
ncbi:helix-turn-helix domain-containing protein [Flavobacterium sp. ARAG 55.4]|uniref:helix-turn-helix domain-containing protein n=1 Tax=Flavobacterium sp. ARAG 55.4 TaxID=3451357 RepID=UPI003F463C41